ncbi:R-spondin-1 [Aplochiton taeniatus]
MQLGLLVLAAVFLGSMAHSDGLKLAKARRQRRISTEGPPSCPNGCEHCSESNGCIKCKPKLFIFLERNDIRQIGVCLASCPMGYFGMRNPDTNRCNQCKIENCEACFNRNFCTKCKEGFYSHRGRCHASCPDGLTSGNGTMECVGHPTVECELAEWSLWGPCMKKNKTCGFKKGLQTRVREPLQALSPADPPSALATLKPCAPQLEEKRCAVPKVRCGNKVTGEVQLLADEGPSPSWSNVSATRVEGAVRFGGRRGDLHVFHPARMPHARVLYSVSAVAPIGQIGFNSDKCVRGFGLRVSGGNRRNKAEGRDEPRRRNKGSTRGRDRDGKESGKGGGGRKRKGPSLTTTATSLTPSSVT